MREEGTEFRDERTGRRVFWTRIDENDRLLSRDKGMSMIDTTEDEESVTGLRRKRRGGLLNSNVKALKMSDETEMTW